MSTELYDEVLRTVGGDPDSLPDRLKTTYLQALCDALGVDTSGMTDKLETSYLEAIIKGYSGGGGGESGVNKLTQRIDGSLTEVTAADMQGVTSIESSAFHMCKNLATIEIPNNLEIIGANAFYSCSSLTKIDIPKSVTTIGNHAFYSCSNLKGVYIEDLSAWCKISFGNDQACPLASARNLYVNGELIENLVIPSDITNILNYTFRGCNAKSITIHDGVTSIGDTVFDGCNEITNLGIPDSVTTIGKSLASGCQKLTSLSIGSGVKSIGNYLVTSYSPIKTITITAETPPTIQSQTFSSLPKTCRIEVLAASLEAYKAATNWSAKADQIFAIEE